MARPIWTGLFWIGWGWANNLTNEPSMETKYKGIDVAQIAPEFNLTERERETVGFLVEGLTSKAIAAHMNISPNTVKAFIRLVMVKMDVSTRSGIVGKILKSHTLN